MVRPLNATKRTLAFARLKSAFALKRTFTVLDATTRESRLLAGASRAVVDDLAASSRQTGRVMKSPTLNGLLTSSAYLNGEATRIA